MLIILPKQQYLIMLASTKLFSIFYKSSRTSYITYHYKCIYIYLTGHKWINIPNVASGDKNWLEI